MEITDRHKVYAKSVEDITVRLDDGRNFTLVRVKESDRDFDNDDTLQPLGSYDRAIWESLDDNTQERIDELVRADLND